MKRAPYPKTDDVGGQRLWRSMDEIQPSPSFDAKIETEFAPGVSEAPASLLGEGLGRRGFLGVMGASIALASLSGCRRPEEKILPYAHAPEEVIPGKPLHFATAMPWVGGAVGLLVESHEGRPTKLEGNPTHPSNKGTTSTFAQASVLDLYDPDRSKAPREKGELRTWDEAAVALRALGTRFASTQGAGLAVLTEGHRSPALKAALKALTDKLPGATVTRWEPLASHAEHDGTFLAFDRPLEASYKLDEARLIVALDADLLVSEPNAVQNARGFARGRDVEARKQDVVRMYAVESSFSATGASADHRLRMKSRDVAAFLVALATELKSKYNQPISAATAELKLGPLSDKAQKWVKVLAKDLIHPDHLGRAVLCPGRKQPAAVHALAHDINVALGAVGRVVDYRPAMDDAGEGPTQLAKLAQDVRSKKVQALVILGGNPVLNAHGKVDFAGLMKACETTVHLSSHLDETSALATWHLNRAHFLEAWGDAVSVDGTASIVQPLIAPLYGGKSDLEVVELLSGGTRKGYELVRKAWEGVLATDQAFRKALRDGVIEGATLPAFVPGPAKGDAVVASLRKLPPSAQGLEVTFEPDPHAWDGRFANNGWMQELPDGMHRLTWGNVAALSPKTAGELGVKDGDVLAITVDGSSVQVPALLAPGHADDSITLTLGQGRKVGTVAAGVGVDVYPLRRDETTDIVVATASATGQHAILARTQEHFLQAGRPMILKTTVDEYAKTGTVEAKDPKRPALLSLWKERDYSAGHAWGMTIDLNQCIGCNACVVACQSENNIPVVGRQGVLDTREMHWLRIDRYFASDSANPELAAEDPESFAQPMLCSHCENAPCEQVCPVGATVHSPEGLNDMAYNRCIGTKYCGNNCPFKVRRFNYLNYAKDIPEPHKAQFNPDVTIRARGVMEKCTFCVQRINTAKIAAHKEGRERVRDGEIVTACQQACPTSAIHFGDLNDPKSEVHARSQSHRAYKLLEELNIKPRVSYLARIKNPNPELAGA